MELNKDYSNYKIDNTVNLNQYKETKDMERIMLKNTHSSVYYRNTEEVEIEERINKIKRLRKLIHFRQKVKDLF